MTSTRTPAAPVPAPRPVYRCTGCGGKGTPTNPLLHGRVGYAHDACDRPS